MRVMIEMELDVDNYADTAEVIEAVENRLESMRKEQWVIATCGNDEFPVNVTIDRNVPVRVRRFNKLSERT